MTHFDAMTEKAIDDMKFELHRARTKFPFNDYGLPALVEEVGELAKALMELHYNRRFVVGLSNDEYLLAHVYKEAIQCASTAIRIASENDNTYNYQPSLEFDFESIKG